MAFGKRRTDSATDERPRADDAPAAENTREVTRVTDPREPEVTVIGPRARLEGLIVSGGPLRVEGEVKGEIRSEGDLVLAPGARVEAEVRAQNVRIEGAFTGNVEVQGRAELGGAATVQGDITCASLVVADGAVFNGRTAMSAGAPVIDLAEREPAGQDA